MANPSRSQSAGAPRLRVVQAGPVEAKAPPPSDEELIQAIENCDGSAADALYERLFGVVDGTLYRVFGRREVDHDDLVQTAFEQIVTTLARRKYARACSLSTWASTIASHVGLNALRARRRERRVFDRGVSADAERLGPVSGDGESRESARAEIRGHLAAMAPEKATTLFLHDVLGHELAEIAVMTGVSVSAAQSRLVRGRRELQDRVRGSA